tara:strand:- start:157 stop:996 length:840 start_codon:yes stop_codon:yes gene_type:complete
MKKRYLAPLILVSANIFFTGSFSLVKFLSIELPVYTIMLSRFLAGPICLGPYFIAVKKRPVVSNWPYMIMRVFFGVTAMTCLFLAFKYGQLAKSMLIFELSVIWTLMYGWLRYGNMPHRYSLMAIPLAFAGMVAVLQPTGFFDFQIGDLFAFLGSILNAGVYVTIKKLRDDHDTSTVVLVSYILSALIMIVPNLIAAPTLNVNLLLGLCAMCTVGFFGQMGMVLGFKFATAGISSLLMLSIIPFTALSGVLIFAESLNLLAWIGIGCVLLALGIIGRWQ